MKKLLPFLILAPFFVVGCAQPSHSQKLRAGVTARVRMTAYTHTEPGGIHNGCGGLLTSKNVRSTASDWSWIPVGTRFKILQTGDICEIDDYGSALVGKQTIDLYTPSRRAMREWGVRFVDIKILQWGSPGRSLEILSPRTRNPHVNRMVTQLRREAGGVPRTFHKIDS